MLDFVAYTVRRRVFQLADKNRPVVGKLQDHGLRCNHPVSRLFPEAVKKCDGISCNVRPGCGRKPSVVPDLVIIIPA